MIWLWPLIGREWSRTILVDPPEYKVAWRIIPENNFGALVDICLQNRIIIVKPKVKSEVQSLKYELDWADTYWS